MIASTALGSLFSTRPFICCQIYFLGKDNISQGSPTGTSLLLLVIYVGAAGSVCGPMGSGRGSRAPVGPAGGGDSRETRGTHPPSLAAGPGLGLIYTERPGAGLQCEHVMGHRYSPI